MSTKKSSNITKMFKRSYTGCEITRYQFQSVTSIKSITLIPRYDKLQIFKKIFKRFMIRIFIKSRQLCFAKPGV